jgi:hypothetical protein
MSITITISDKATKVIKKRAKENGKDVEHFVEEFLEENFATKPDKEKERKHNLLEFVGMFSSGKADTSERMHEILYSEDFDPAEGFSLK